MALTAKQKRFADEFIISGNAEDAAVKAGYSKRYARGNAYKLVANSGIKAYIEEQIKEIEDEKIAKQEEVLKYLTSVLRGEETEDVLIGTGKGRQSVTSVEVSAKDRIKAAELIGKRYCMWTDKQEISIEPTIISGVDKLED